MAIRFGHPVSGCVLGKGCLVVQLLWVPPQKSGLKLVVVYGARCVGLESWWLSCTRDRLRFME